MNLKTVPNKAVMWKRLMKPDPTVFRIGAMLVEPEISTERWKTIEELLSNLIQQESWELFGGDLGFDFQYGLLPFMIGRLNQKRARILELCMYANVTKDNNYFKNARDIVEGIIEIEEWVMSSDAFSHNFPPRTVLLQTVFPLRPLVYIEQID